jgi:hypothetical protein
MLQLSGADARAARVSMWTAALTIGHHVAAKSLREGLFLATFSVTDLPKAMLGAALAAIPSALFVARWMARFGPARLAPAMFAASALTSLLEWWYLPSAPRAVAIVVYAHISIGGALLMSAFWSSVSERFDPHTLKNLVGRIGASGTLGGLIGGIVMERVAHWAGARSTLLLVALLALAAAASAAQLEASGGGAPGATLPPAAKTRFTGYLWGLGLLVAASAIASTFGDFALKQAAASRFTSVEALVRFFALFYTGTALVGFALQALVSRRLLDTIGVGGTLAVPPAAGVALGALSLLSPSLLTIASLRGADLALGPSLFRTAFEPLFAPVPAALKRRSKALIDVVFDKGGDALSSSLILGLSYGGPLLVQRAPLFLVSLASALSLYLSLRARQGYVAALEASLRAGTLNLDTVESDATTRLALSATAIGIDRDKLVQQIELHRQANGESPATPLADASLSMSDELLVSDVQALLGSNAQAIRAVLSRPEPDARLAAFVVPHLGRDAHAKLAVLALRGMGPGVAGLLADAMLSRSAPLAVRRRIPYVLRSLRGESVAKALTRALSAEVVEVRYRAALALHEVSLEEPALLPDRSQVYALALSELGHGPPNRDSVDHVFALLALGITGGVLELARQGVLSEDPKLRGTALEYLASLLPESVRTPLVAALAKLSPVRRATPRNPAELVDELERSLRVDIRSPTLSRDPD